MTTYKPGSLIRLTVTFTDLTTQLPADPGTVVVTIYDPSGATITPAPTVVKDSVGNYHADLTNTAAPGVYRFKWVGTAPVVAVQEGSTWVTDVLIVPRAIDLTDVPTVRTFCELQSDADDGLIQIGISGFSMFMLHACGYGPADGSVPTQSPLVQQVPFNEWYDGNGHNRLFLRNSPIGTVTVLTINGRAIPASTAWGLMGWVVDDTRKSISLRAGGGGSSGTSNFFSARGGGLCFIRDNVNPQNINVQYTAGYAGVPFDLAEMAMRVVGQNYKRRQWIDLASKSISAQGGTGTTRYRDWAMSPLDEKVLLHYKRVTY